MPEEPTLDVITGSLLNTFRNVARGRRYLVGAAAILPLRLSAREITDWLEAHPLPLPRHLIDEVVFALDELALSEAAEQSNN